MNRVGDWIQTYTGRQFWPCDPRPEEIHIEDIAHSLSMQCRFTGHCEQFYSVAEHSVRVSEILPGNSALWGLMHDASEAYLTDLSRPLKRGSGLGPIYKAMESRLMRAVCERFGMPIDEPAEVKKADNCLLMTEKRDLMRSHGSLPKWSEPEDPLDEIIIPWSWLHAKSVFLEKFSHLTQAGIKY